MDALFGIMVFISAVCVGAVIVWNLYSRYPKYRHWIVWGMMAFGILIAYFSLSAGVYFGVLGAAMHALSETGESSP